jgi:membrane protein YdbS with pleckstrin-like domain
MHRGARRGPDPSRPDGPWLRPDRSLTTLRLVETLAVALVALVVAVAVTLGSPRALAVTIGILAAAAVGSAWTVVRRVAAWGYAERGDDMVIRRGVLVRRLSVVPYGRMQFVDVTAGPLERVFGLATVRMHTAAAASDVRIPGLAAAEAGRLRDRLTELGEARAAGL